MAIINLGSGPPFRGSLIYTNPIQLRFVQKSDQAYTIRLNYVAIPTDITASAQTLDLPEQFHEFLYLKFVEKVSMSLGEFEIANLYRSLYDDHLRKHKHTALGKHLKHEKLRFSWL